MVIYILMVYVYTLQSKTTTNQDIIPAITKKWTEQTSQFPPYHERHPDLRKERAGETGIKT